MAVSFSQTRRIALAAIASLLAMALVYSLRAADPTPPIAADAGTLAPSPPGMIVVTYIANEGVLITSGETKILIDGLHRRYQRGYPYLPEPYRERIETAVPPFDGVDLVLVSHRHLDHFHPESVGRHLLRNPDARLVSSQQVVAEVEKHFSDYATIQSRVTTVTPPLTERVAMTVAGVDMQIIGAGHGSGRHASIQNLGHLITLGGKKLLHLGDADADPAIFEKLRLDEQGVDVAFLPMWFLTGEQGPQIVRDRIKPRHIVAVHMPASGADSAAAEIKRRFPEAVAFTTLLEKRTY
jgi:L-ascorbate metabolism protein UlaG (beta-lactamase superfamily)